MQLLRAHMATGMALRVNGIDLGDGQTTYNGFDQILLRLHMPSSLMYPV